MLANHLWHWTDDRFVNDSRGVCQVFASSTANPLFCRVIVRSLKLCEALNHLLSSPAASSKSTRFAVPPPG